MTENADIGFIFPTMAFKRHGLLGEKLPIDHKNTTNFVLQFVLYQIAASLSLK